MTQRTSFRNQMAAIEYAARILKNPTLLDARTTLEKVCELDRELHEPAPNQEKIDKLLEILFIR